jgi:hypothetical protein
MIGMGSQQNSTTIQSKMSLRTAVVVCLFSSAVAFTKIGVQSHVLGLSKSSSALKKISCRRNDASSLQMMSPLALTMPAKVMLSLPIMYATMSFSEYVTHRYYQHTDYNKNAVMQFFANLFTNNKGHKIRGGGHVEHHAETLDDMSLRNDARWIRSPAAVFLNADKYRGTAFSWWAGTIPIEVLLDDSLAAHPLNPSILFPSGLY